MDYKSGSRCLIRQNECPSISSIPSSILAGLTLKLDNDDSIIQTFAEIEQCHWDYLDNYRVHNRRKYPGYKIGEFAKRVFRQLGQSHHTMHIPDWIRMYNKYKKSLPTAGVIMYHVADDIRFVTVKMRHSNIWSMPKGKKDSSDATLLTTARREFHEETGIDVEDCISTNTTCKTLNRTVFYLLETDHVSNHFDGYNSNEIGDVCWSSATHVCDNPHNYSKQTVSAAKYLLNNYF